MSKNMERKIKVIDQRDDTYEYETIESIEGWSKLEIPKWCDVVKFDDNYFYMESSGHYHATVAYKDVFGSWGSPTTLA